jgi:ribose 5-phosphate isomerase B
MAANKFNGIRAALCDDAETARGARLWNNANVLCLSMRRTSEVVLKETLDMWFNTSYEPNETDDACLRIIDEIENSSREGFSIIFENGLFKLPGHFLFLGLS